MKILIVRSCLTSKGEISCDVPGGTRDVEIEVGDLEAQNLIAAGHARLLPPAPAVDPSAPGVGAAPASDSELASAPVESSAAPASADAPAPTPAPAPAPASEDPAPAPAAAAEPATEEIH